MITKNFCEKSLSVPYSKVIKYNICESKHSGQTHYGIQIVEQTEEIHGEETIESISPDREFVCALLLYLCENLIDTVHFKDIVDDYILESEDTV